MTNEFEDDVSLVERCVRSDLVAWAALIKKYSNLVSISIDNRLKRYGFTLSHQEIEDIRQNVLASIWKNRKLEGTRNRKDISYWLAIVSGNEAIAYIRKRQFQEELKKRSLFERIDEKELSELIPLTKSSPRDELSNDELSKTMDEAIESLPSKENLIIKLNLIHNKKYKEIAKILNLPTGTVSNYIRRAKERLKERLKDFR